MPQNMLVSSKGDDLLASADERPLSAQIWRWLQEQARPGEGLPSCLMMVVGLSRF